LHVNAAVHATRAPITLRSQSLATLKAERQRQADEVRRMKQASHEETSRTTVVSRRRSDGDFTGTTRRRTRQETGDVVAAWLASLEAVGTEYRRAKAEKQAAALREKVRLRREAREDSRTTAVSEIDRQRMRAALTEQKDRRTVSSALERQASSRRQSVVSCLEARRRTAEFMSARRENVALADNVARRIGACSKAHVRFVQQEHKDFRRELAATAIERQRHERRQRDVEIERVVDVRRKAVTTQANADRFVMRSLRKFTSPSSPF